MKQSCLLDGNGEPKMIRNFAVAIGLYRVTAQAKGRDVTVRHEVMLEVVPS